MKITLHSNPRNIPGCILITTDNGKEILIQTDYNFPGIASTFGCQINDSWDISKQIAKARDYIDKHDGKTVEDPGYFENL